MSYLCQNRKARHEYEILSTIEAGVVLQGCEVKSLRDHKASLDGSYALIEKGELWLINSHIDEYKQRNTFGPSYNPLRRRKLLLHKRELNKFGEKAAQKGYTLIPLNFYLKDGKVKVELAIARGRQLHDKRAAEKEKEVKKELKKDWGT